MLEVVLCCFPWRSAGNASWLYIRHETEESRCHVRAQFYDSAACVLDNKSYVICGGKILPGWPFSL